MIYVRKSDPRQSAYLATIVLLTSLILAGLVTNSPSRAFANVVQGPPVAQDVQTAINVTFTESSQTIYERSTRASKSGPGADQFIIRYSTVIDLTTHQDLYIQFTIDFSPLKWNNNFANFSSNVEIQNLYNRTYKALTSLLRNEIDVLQVLGITARSFFLRNSSLFISNVQTQVFEIEEKIVLHEATAFILNLQEPFRFDLNAVELGTLSNFHFESIYELKSQTSSQITEKLVISAPGTPLEFDAASQGYYGDVYLRDHPGPIPSYQRDFFVSEQDITFTLVLPASQVITKVNYDAGFSNPDFPNTTDPESASGNQYVAVFTSGSTAPAYISLVSEKPIWAQFSLSDYLSWGVSGLVAAIGLLRGVPFLLGRKKTSGFHHEMRRGALEGNWPTVDGVLKNAFESLLKGKMGQKQFQDLVSEHDVIRTFMKNTQHITGGPQGGENPPQ